ncbi:MAG: peptidoglycan DD-metalloendopeptidase family protein [Deltaproteobacteria bacterium]|nr:peptidoglycan DD-metalloendopeptidase family protein [Deltaproteobacteria bacterium]
MTTDIGNFVLPDSRLRGLDSELRTPNSELPNRQVAEEFASLLLLEVMKAMRATLSGESLGGDESSSHDMYTSLADTEVTRALAKRDGIGLAKFILRGMGEEAQDTEGRGQQTAPLPLLFAPRSSLRRGSSIGYAPLFPVPTGEVSSGFGPRPDPLEGDERFHSGMDIAAPAGSPIKAVAAGSVVFSGRADGYGNLVVIDHGDGLVTRYAHTGASLVSTGQQVAAGQEIALVGTSGRSTGPHLHFEVHKEGEPIDPELFLSRHRS